MRKAHHQKWLINKRPASGDKPAPPTPIINVSSEVVVVNKVTKVTLLNRRRWSSRVLALLSL